MIKSYRSALLIAALVTTAASVVPVLSRADEAPLPPLLYGWGGKGELGYVMSQGNDDAQTANAKVDLAHASGPWKDTLHLEALYAKSASIVSAERWAGLFQSNYQVTKPAFVFGALHYENDKFSGFAYQASVSAGAGYNFIDTSTNKLSGQIGVGYRDLRPETLIKNAAGAVIYRVPLAASDSAIGTAEIDAEHDFNATTKITDKALMEAGSNDTLLQNDFALTVQMSSRLALSAGYSLHDNSSPPAGVKKVDTLTTLNLVFQL